MFRKNSYMTQLIFLAFFALCNCEYDTLELANFAQGLRKGFELSTVYIGCRTCIDDLALAEVSAKINANRLAFLPMNSSGGVPLPTQNNRHGILLVGPNWNEVLEEAFDKGATKSLRHWFVEKASVNASVMNLRLDSLLFTYTKLHTMYLIEETYRVKRGKVITNSVGNGAAEKIVLRYEMTIFGVGDGIYRCKNSAPRRPIIAINTFRTQGTTLIANVESWVPLVDYEESSPLNVQRAWGLFPEVFYTMEARLNFTYEFIRPADMFWGSELPNGTWTGLVGQLQRHEADICLGGLNPTPKRFEVADFPYNILSDRVSAITQIPKSPSLNLYSYLGIFSPEASAAFMALVQVYAAIFVFLNRFSHGDKLHPDSDPEKFGYSTAVALVLTTFSKIHQYPIEARKTSVRIVLITMQLTFLVLFVAYTCVLFMKMATKSPPKLITSLRDVIDLDYGIAVLGEDFVYEHMATAPKDTVEAMVFEQKIKGKPESLIEGYYDEEVNDKILNNDKFIFFGSLYDLYEPETLPFVQLDVDEDLNTQITFGLQRDSEFLGLINSEIALLKESGVLDKLIKDNKPKVLRSSQLEGASKDPASSLIVLGYEHLIFPFFCLPLGALFAVLIALLERYWPRSESVPAKHPERAAQLLQKPNFGNYYQYLD